MTDATNPRSRRRPSPYPSFAGPAAIRHADATLHLWGDAEAGYVGDRIYVSSDRIHMLELALPPGGRFGHSEENRTIFAADEVYHVLEGELLIVNPETGEAAAVRAGEAVFFRRDTWHHGLNRSHDRPMRAVELFAPPPASGASSAYARTRPGLPSIRYADDRWLGRWPMARAERDAQRSFHVIRDGDLLWRMDDPSEGLLVGIVASTEHLTVGRGRLLPGQRGGVERHAGDKALVVLEGTLNVFLPEAPTPPSWFELRPGDGFYLPAGTAHRFFATHASPTEYLFGVAPAYGSPPASDA